MSVIVCAYNEERYLPACLHSVLAQTRIPDQIIVVNNASSDATGAVGRRIEGVTVIDEPRKGLTRARETGRKAASGELLVYLDADCRAPLTWLERVEHILERNADVVAVTGPYRFYDWHLWGRMLIGAYDRLVAPLTHVAAQRIFRVGALLYGGNFAVRRPALDRVGGFDERIEFHGEDTNLGRRLSAVGHVVLSNACWLHTSARRYKALGTLRVMRLYARNFWSETMFHRQADRQHLDVRT